MYLPISALTDLLGCATFALARTVRGRMGVLVGGGEAGVSSYMAPPVVVSTAKSLDDMMRGLVFFVRVSVELPISCSTPLDCLLLTLREPVRVPEQGETFSLSETPDQLLEFDFGVTFRLGTAAPRKPAFLSCNLLVCREVPGPDRGRQGESSLLFSPSCSGMGGESNA